MLQPIIMKPTIILDYSQAKLNFADRMREAADFRGCPGKYNSNTGKTTQVLDTQEFLSYNDCKQIIDAEGEVLNYESYCAFAPSLLNDEVPANFPDRTYTDENEVEHVYTWGEYLTTPGYLGADGKQYVIMSHKQNFIDVKYITPLLLNPKYDWITKQDYIDNRPVEEL